MTEWRTVTEVDAWGVTRVVGGHVTVKVAEPEADVEESDAK